MKFNIYINFILFFALSIPYAIAQNKINKYEYWFDQDFANKNTTAVSATADFNLNTSIPTSSLTPGVHVFNIRFIDDSTLSSSVLSSFFIKLNNTGNTSNKEIISYEYWFDNDYLNKISNNSINGSTYLFNSNINTNGLSTGVHVINFRFKDSDQQWSSTLSSFFIKVNTSAGNGSSTMTDYEFWFDNDYQNKQIGILNNITNDSLVSLISASTITNGVHTINIRFKDSNGLWSSTLSQFFIKQGSNISNTPNVITQYEYWYDNDFANKVIANTTNNQNIQVLENFDANSLAMGVHTLNFRAKDNRNLWSSTVSQFFIKQNIQSNNNAVMSKCEYWFNENYSNKQTVTLNNTQTDFLTSLLPTSTLNKGLNIINLRFCDSNGKWSSTLSQFFFKQGEAIASTQNLISSYRYWFDTNDTNIKTVNLQTPVNPYHLLSDIDLTRIWKGEHIVHFQFKDTLQQWSVVTSDTITKNSLPIADFNSNLTVLCDSGEVSFINNSIDGDIYHWSFGDGDTSDIINPVHFYRSAGVYTVTLTITDTITGVDSSLTLSNFITVSSTPVFTLGTDTSYCANQSFSLTIPVTTNNYSWSIGNNNQQISTNLTGTLVAYATDNFGCSYSDTINLNHLPIPQVYLGEDTALCEGETKILDAGNDGISYSWSTGENTNLIIATTSNIYIATVTNQYNCVNADSINIVFNINPVINLGSDTSICLGDSITLNAYNTNSTYLWSNGNSNSSIVISDTGNYNVLVTNEFNCTSTDEINIGIIPNTIANYNFSTNFLELSLINNSIGATHYSWSFGDGNTSNLMNPVYTYQTNGQYEVCLISYNDCFSDTVCQNIDVYSVGIVNSSKTNVLSVYPNPTSGSITISTNIKSGAIIKLFDANGRLIINDKVVTETGNYKLNLNSLSNGVYHLTLQDGNCIKSARIVKNN